VLLLVGRGQRIKFDALAESYSELFIALVIERYWKLSADLLSILKSMLKFSPRITISTMGTAKKF
jgi:hypothetical protein